MSYLTELREQKRIDKWADTQIRESVKDAARRRQHEDRTANEQRKQHRKAQRRVTRSVWVRQLPERGMAALWATMIVLPISLAWQAQALFALEVLRLPAPFNHGFPASIELAAWLCAFEAHLRRRRGESAGLMPTYMWSLAGVAAAVNFSHGLGDAGLPAGLGLAAVSLIGIVLHSARQSLEAGKASGTAHVRLALWRRLRYPRLSLAATSLRAARDGLTVDEAWELAWLDRFGVGPDAPRSERRLTRLAIRRDAREDRKAVRDGNAVVVDGRVQKGFAPEVRELIDRERQAALDAALKIQQEAQDVLTLAGVVFGPDPFGPDETDANPADEQGVPALSPRATELLPALQEALDQGAIAPTLSVKSIIRWVRRDLNETLGTPVAMELRDHVRRLRAVPGDSPTEPAVAAGGAR